MSQAFEDALTLVKKRHGLNLEALMAEWLSRDGIGALKVMGRFEKVYRPDDNYDEPVDYWDVEI